MSLNDSIKWHPVVDVFKYSPETVREIMDSFGLEEEPSGSVLEALRREHGVMPDEMAHAEGNSLSNVGKTRLGNLLIGSGAAAFTNALGVIGVGDSSTANGSPNVFTSLQAGTNTYYQGLDATYPTNTVGVVVANSTFASGNGNYVWNEWCWAIATTTPVGSSNFNTATTTGVMLNRAVQNLGTKVSGAIWTLQATITLS